MRTTFQRRRNSASEFTRSVGLHHTAAMVSDRQSDLLRVGAEMVRCLCRVGMAKNVDQTLSMKQRQIDLLSRARVTQKVFAFE